jgi:hypothetical protein
MAVRDYVVRMDLEITPRGFEFLATGRTFVTFLGKSSGPAPISSLPTLREIPLPWVTFFKTLWLRNHGVASIFLATAP